MRILFKILGLIFGVFIIMMVAAGILINFMDIPEQHQFEVVNVPLDSIENGTYTGEYANGLVKAIVKVEVTDGKIVGISIEEHKNGRGKKAERIIDEIINKQTLDVDAISGATTSSNVIRKAIELALKQ